MKFLISILKCPSRYCSEKNPIKSPVVPAVLQCPVLMSQTKLQQAFVCGNISFKIVPPIPRVRVHVTIPFIEEIYARRQNRTCEEIPKTATTPMMISKI